MKKFINIKFDKLQVTTLLTLSFLSVILLGSFILMMPISRNVDIKYIDALFTSTTATCVTGLVTQTIATDFTVFGQAIILLLIQVGGIGIMSCVAFIMLIFGKRLDVKETNIIKESLNSNSSYKVIGYLKSVVAFTFFVEFIGFLILITQLYDGSLYSVFQALFLSISSFCNAGIDIFGSSSLMEFKSNIIINFTVMALIFLGGIGFVVYVDIRNNLKLLHKFKYNLKSFISRLKVHTKIVLITTFVLIAIGSLLTFILEYDHALKYLDLKDKLLASLFNSITLRTAGFFTINNAYLTRVSKMFMSLLMIIGGSPGGTAGGLKTTTIFLCFIALFSVLKKSQKIHIFKKYVTHDNVIKGFSIIFIYMIVVITSLMIMCLIEPFDTLDLLFEIASAIGTVGLTVGITTKLTFLGKLVIIILMFIGRLGPVTIALFLKNSKKENSTIKYPLQEIIVG